jgi:hypothetical protein
MGAGTVATDVAVGLKRRIRDSQDRATLRRRRSYLWGFRLESTTDCRGIAHCRGPTLTLNLPGSPAPLDQP